MAENHLFIIWEKGRGQEQAILLDIRKHFSILRIIEISWSEENASKNFTRFYGVNLPSNSFKEIECGTGCFLAIIVQDNHPIYDLRKTNRGMESVNINMFDSKCKYREWTGGGHKIHATNNTAEFRHDITLLFGKNDVDLYSCLPNTDGIIKIQKDIVGANGWDSREELFYVLNNTVDYVILRGQEQLENYTDRNQDIDILTRDIDTCYFILNGETYCNSSRPHQEITIKGETYIIDLWDIHRNYFDIFWCDDMLKHKVYKQYYYTLDKKNQFYCLLYHCLVNKNQIADKYRAIINNHPKDIAIKESDPYFILVQFLESNNYEIIKPKDSSIELHIDNKYLKQYYNKYGLCVNKSCCFQFDIGTGEELRWKSCVYDTGKSIIKAGSHWLIENEKKQLLELSNSQYTPHVISTIQQQNGAAIEIEKINGVSLDVFFKKKKNIKKKHVKKVIQQAIHHIIDLRNRGVLHRDLCCPNIIIKTEKKKCNVYIIDFGWAVSVTDEFFPRPCNLALGACPGEMYSDFYTFGETLKAIFPKQLHYVKRVISALQQILWDDYFDNKSYFEKEKILFDALNSNFNTKDHILLFFFRHKKAHRYYHSVKKTIKKSIKWIEP